MDIRSFELNFEVNAVIYNSQTTREMEDIFENPQQEYTQKLIAAIPRCVKKNSGRSAKTEEAHG